tara:strand:+ start:8128 stop:9420 length:1293 start_codon:yes stop_codon:yes gene_type:complete
MSIKRFYSLAKTKLYGICRSITGEGTLKTLNIIKQQFPKLKIKRIKSGTKAFDWKIPPEWNVTEAYVIDKYKKKIIDFNNNNLHLVGYSSPINKFLNKKELFKHINTLKNQPNAIPYVTSYYKKYWGFCISEKNKKEIDKSYSNLDKFKVVIKSTLNKKGYLNYGELILKGKSKQEILISTYICHPSMANNELSGPIVSMSLIEYFQKKKKLEKSIRFIFIPETIGSISYLSLNLKRLKDNVIGGYNLSCIGDDRKHSCMFSKYKNSQSDKSLAQAYKNLNIKYKVFSFLERGSDERQYNSPGVDLPIASIFRSKYGEFPEYHTSLDDFSLVTIKGINGGFKVAKEAISILLRQILPKARYYCEPQMGKRNLYSTLSIKNNKSKTTQSLMDFLQYCDGKNNLDDISLLIKQDKKTTKKIYNILKNYKIII